MRVDNVLLDQVRREKGLKKNAVAELAGVPAKNAYKVFAGKNNAPDTVMKLAEALNVPISKVWRD